MTARVHSSALPDDPEDPRGDLCWGSIPRLVSDAAARFGSAEAIADGDVRMSFADLEEAALVVRGRRVAPHVKALVVPGSQGVSREAEARGIDKVFTTAGFEWRGAGCSMCLAMNPDKLVGREICASSSNRNFKGRQGSPTGRTLLMSPAMVAAAAINGAVADVREMM